MRKEYRTELCNGGMYGCFKEELQEVIDTLNDDDELYIVSIKMLSNITVYSFPGKIEKIRGMLGDIVDSMENEEVIKVGTTWVNTKNIVTIRMCKYIGENNNGY